MPQYYDATLSESDDEARTPLFRRSSSDAERSRTERERSAGAISGTMINRIMVILTLVVLVLVSNFFQSNQIKLTQKLSQDEETIQKLQDTIHEQGAVINRFNSSVTNSDVLKRLTTLEYKLDNSVHELREEIATTVKNVTQQLDNTMVKLEETVNNAEREISQNVEQVKKDYEEFERKTNDQFSMENSFMVWQLAGTFTLLSCLISMWHMSAHLRKFNQPLVQRKILAILWMCPIYGCTSWCSLVFPETEGYLAIIKDSYEAYVIYQFLSFCISVLGKGDREKVVNLLAKRADHLSPPVSCRSLCFCFCKEEVFENDHAKARAVLLQCQKFAMQFVFWRPVTTIAKVVLKKYDYYGPFGADSPNDYRAPQFYIFLITNISIFTAFTGLLKFYHAVDKDLAWCRPFAKFLCIKGVVFMTFWQGLAISVLAQTLHETSGDPEEWATKSQNFLICLEMLIFSLAHYYCFPTNEWQDDYEVNYQKLNIGDSIALGDFFSDLKLVMQRQKRHKKKKKTLRRTPSQPTVEEGDEESNTGEISTEYGSDDETADDGSLSTTVSTDRKDVEEAQRRLSKFLDDMTFSSPRARADIETGSRSAPFVSPLKTSAGLYSAGTDAITESTEKKQEADTSAKTPTSGVATEQTGLLKSESKSTPLKPSVFTNIADIAERSVCSQDDDSHAPMGC